MSQSDYLKQKRTANILKDQSKLSPILLANDYATFKSFSIANSISDSSPTYNILKVPNTQQVFDMVLDTSKICPLFPLCENTQDRANRRPLQPYQSTCFPVMKAPGLKVPTYYNGSTKKRPEKPSCECA